MSQHIASQISFITREIVKITPFEMQSQKEQLELNADMPSSS
jgi:hypothetical protein